jgi:hypothetical protein
LFIFGKKKTVFYSKFMCMILFLQDVGAFGIAPKGIVASEAFKSQDEKLLATKRKRVTAIPDIIPGGSVLESMVAPVL